MKEKTKEFYKYLAQRLSEKELAEVENQAELEYRVLKILQHDISVALLSYMDQEEIGVNELIRRSNMSPTLVNKIKKEEVKKMGVLKCVECGVEQDLPMHCGQPMHLEDNQLVCWMGPNCGIQLIPDHHRKQMKIIKKFHISYVN